MSIVSEITRIKNNIASAYTAVNSKGGTLPQTQNSSNLATAINSITGGGSTPTGEIAITENGTYDVTNYASANVNVGEWEPQDDWWDIDSILENDTEDYPAKMIVLFTDEAETTTFNYNVDYKAAMLKTSDGATYTFNQAITHTWDTTKDKVCSLGYKTRYYIVYFSSTESFFYWNAFLTYNNDNSNSLLYIIVKNLNANVATASGSTFFNNNKLLERVKCINSVLTVGTHAFSSCTSLVEVDNVKFTNSGFYCFCFCSALRKINNLIVDSSVTALNYSFYGCSALLELNLEDTSSVNNFQVSFNSSTNLIKINKIDFNSATNIGSAFDRCASLRCIDEVSNIKITGLNLSTCNLLRKDTLLRFLNALYDYSESEDTYTLTLGSVNLSKLTDEEKAIATSKGWTLA